MNATEWEPRTRPIPKESVDLLSLSLRCNWHAALCKFKVYTIMTSHTYIAKWLLQWV